MTLQGFRNFLIMYIDYTHQCIKKSYCLIGTFSLIAASSISSASPSKPQTTEPGSNVSSCSDSVHFLQIMQYLAISKKLQLPLKTRYFFTKALLGSPNC